MAAVFHQQISDLIERFRLQYSGHPIPSYVVKTLSWLNSVGYDIEIEHLRLRQPDIPNLVADMFKRDPKIWPLAHLPPLFSDPGKLHFADGSGSVQLLRSLPYDPNYKGAAYRIQSDSPHKEATQNTGMSGAGGSKGKSEEPTKDDEVANRGTMPWKLGLSVEAVTPNFIASAKISLEMKSGSGSNSKQPPLPPMPTPLVGKLYNCFLGYKKKFID